MTSAPTLSREVQEELVRRVLNGHEQSLLRLAMRGKSLAAIAQLYRQYEGENAVEEALVAIKRKLERAAGQRLKAATDPTRARVRHLPQVAVEVSAADPALVAQGAGSLGSSGSNGRMEKPARPAEPARVSETPPNGAAPASDRGGPSSSGSSVVAASPAPGRRSAGWGEARKLVLAALERGPLTVPELLRVTGISRSSASRVFVELREQDKIAGMLMPREPGKPGGSFKVWRLVEPGECAHGRPHVECGECAPPLPGVDAGKQNGNGLPAELPEPEFPPRFAEGTFDAQALWDSLSPERQKLLVRVVLREAVYPAVTSVLLG
jgi:hypothetical protein